MFSFNNVVFHMITDTQWSQLVDYITQKLSESPTHELHPDTLRDRFGILSPFWKDLQALVYQHNPPFVMEPHWIDRVGEPTAILCSPRS